MRLALYSHMYFSQLTTVNKVESEDSKTSCDSGSEQSLRKSIDSG